MFEQEYGMSVLKEEMSVHFSNSKDSSEKNVTTIWFLNRSYKILLAETDSSEPNLAIELAFYMTKNVL